MTSPAAVVAVVAVAAGTTGWAATRASAADRALAVRGRLEVGPPHAGGPPEWFVELVRLGELATEPARAWPVAWRVGVALGVGMALWMPLGAAVVAMVAAGAVAMRRRSAAGREVAGFDPALLVAIDRMVAAMASGSSLATSVHEVGALPSVVGRDLALASRRHRQGQSLQAALDQWARHRPSTAAALVADALALAGATGGSQRQALEGVRATVQERQTLRREVRALGSQARASMVVLVTTPIAFSAFVAFVDPRVATFFLRTPPGWACAVGGLGLNAVGAMWMRRITRGVLA